MSQQPSSSNSGPNGQPVASPAAGGQGGQGNEDELFHEAARSDVLVIDTGSSSVKVGWAGEELPRAVVPTVLLDVHTQALPAGTLSKNGEIPFWEDEAERTS